MKYKHRITSIFLVLVLILIMGSIAAADEQGYNGTTQEVNDTSTRNALSDGAKSNTKLVIDQQQFQRTVSNGEVQVKTYSIEDELVEGVYEAEAFDKYEAITIWGNTYKFWRDVKNAIDDIVVVTNVANESDTTAYIRTVFAFPVFSDGYTHLYLNFHKSELLEEVEGIAEIKGKNYKLYVYNYSTLLAPGETSEPSLLEYAFDKNVTTDMIEEFGGSYEVLITSQAVQGNGFTTFANAFNSAFSNVTVNNHPWN